MESTFKKAVVAVCFLMDLFGIGQEENNVDLTNARDVNFLNEITFLFEDIIRKTQLRGLSKTRITDARCV